MGWLLLYLALMIIFIRGWVRWHSHIDPYEWVDTQVLTQTPLEQPEKVWPIDPEDSKQHKV